MTLQYVLRTFDRLRRIANRIDAETLAELLAKHVGWDRIAYPAQFADDVNCYMREYIQKHPNRHCIECGTPLNCLYDRADARYCSPACRQKAYRKRVMARTSLAAARAVTCDASDPCGEHPIRNERNAG
jgi:predicted nucleic acid-binding Zn ribbon protein